ncbi:MAG: aldo/keto reductase [Planctomycetota bacterium]
MKYLQLGNTGLEVSELGFGGIPIQRVSHEEAVRVVRFAYESGITFFDTAAGYGTSEERIGEALDGVRDKCVIATKNGAADADGCREQIERSLKGLRTDYLDLFQFHACSSREKYERIMAPGGAYEAATTARDEGLVRRIGVSSHSAEVALETVKSGDFETVQFPLNLIATGAADDIFPEADKRGMGVIVMKPLGGGPIEDAAAAFAFLRQYPQWIPIPGIETKEQLAEILGVYERENVVTEEVKARWEEIRGDLGMYFCRRCGYCGPCPQGVGIDGLMTLDTLMKRFPKHRLLSEQWIVNNVESIENCADCGDCEDKCPYNLSIREKMRANLDAYARWRREVTGPKA